MQHSGNEEGGRYHSDRPRRCKFRTNSVAPARYGDAAIDIRPVDATAAVARHDEVTAHTAHVDAAGAVRDAHRAADIDDIDTAGTVFDDYIAHHTIDIHIAGTIGDRDGAAHVADGEIAGAIVDRGGAEPADLGVTAAVGHFGLHAQRHLEH